MWSRASRLDGSSVVFQRKKKRAEGAVLPPGPDGGGFPTVCLPSPVRRHQRQRRARGRGSRKAGWGRSSLGKGPIQCGRVAAVAALEVVNFTAFGSRSPVAVRIISEELPLEQEDGRAKPETARRGGGLICDFVA